MTLSARPFKNSTPRLPTETETAGDDGTAVDEGNRRSRVNVIDEVTILDRRRAIRVTNVGESGRG